MTTVAMTLPPEILQEIFKNLRGVQALKCRAVCKSWKEAVDGLTDSQWNMICEKEYMYSVYKKVHDKSTITWRETFRALNSWANIRSAELECRQLPALIIQEFKVLPNRIIAVLTNSNEASAGRYLGTSDTIVYYNIDTLKELERKTYEYAFRTFDENEHLIVLLFSNSQLLLVQKANNKKKVVGRLYTLDYWHLGQFGLFGKKVYFQGEDGLIYLSKLKETKKGESIIRTAPLKAFEENHDSFEEYIISFGYMDNHLTILTDEGNVYEYADKDFGLLSKFRWHSGDITGELDEYGFDWTSPMLYSWLVDRYAENVQINKIKHESLVMHGPVILLGTHKKRMVHFISLLSIPDGESPLYNRKPIRTVSMNKLEKMGKERDSIRQMDVVESVDHHVVIVLTGERVFLLKLAFDASEETESEDEDETDQSVPTKRKAASKNVQPKTKAKKMVMKPKAKTQTCTESKHRYNTRNRTLQN